MKHRIQYAQFKQRTRSTRGFAAVAVAMAASLLAIPIPMAESQALLPTLDYSRGFFLDHFAKERGVASGLLTTLPLNGLTGTLKLGNVSAELQAFRDDDFGVAAGDTQPIYSYEGQLKVGGMCLPTSFVWLGEYQAISGAIYGPSSAFATYYITTSISNLEDAVEAENQRAGDYLVVQSFRFVKRTEPPPPPPPPSLLNLSELQTTLQIPAPATIDPFFYLCQAVTPRVKDPSPASAGAGASMMSSEGENPEVGCHRCGSGIDNLFITDLGDEEYARLTFGTTSEYRYVGYPGSYDDIKLGGGLSTRYMYQDAFSDAYPNSGTSSSWVSPLDVKVLLAAKFYPETYGHPTPLRFTETATDHSPTEKSTATWSWSIDIGVGWTWGPVAAGVGVSVSPNFRDEDGATTYMSGDRRHIFTVIDVPKWHWPGDEEHAVGFRALLETMAGPDANLDHTFATWGQIAYARRYSASYVPYQEIASDSINGWRDFQVADYQSGTTKVGPGMNFDVADRGMSSDAPDLEAVAMPTSRSTRFDLDEVSDLYVFHELVGDPSIPHAWTWADSGVSNNMFYYAGWYDDSQETWNMFYPLLGKPYHEDYPIDRDIVAAHIPGEWLEGDPREQLNQRSYTVSLWRPNSNDPYGEHITEYYLVDHMSFVVQKDE